MLQVLTKRENIAGFKGEITVKGTTFGLFRFFYSALNPFPLNPTLDGNSILVSNYRECFNYKASDFHVLQLLQHQCCMPVERYGGHLEQNTYKT